MWKIIFACYFYEEMHLYISTFAATITIIAIYYPAKHITNKLIFTHRLQNDCQTNCILN